MKTRNLLLAVIALSVVAFGAAQLYAAVTESSTNVPLAIPDNGNGNSTTLEQSGSGNQAFTAQLYGSDNQITVKQADTLNVAYVTQGGTGNIARVDQSDSKILTGPAMNLGGIVGEIDGDIRIMQEVIREVFLDIISLIAQTNNKFAHALSAKALHDMPQNRFAANLDHRLGA